MPDENLDLNAPATSPAIENEFPAYRAVSGPAVLSVILGVFSFLTFTNLYFLAVPVAAVVIGGLADRKIRRYPDVLTGLGLAQAGIALGLVFGLTAVTVTTVQGLIRVSQAKAYARAYEKLLKEGSFAQAVWFAQHPEMRSSITPDKLLDELNKPGAGQTMFEEHYHTVRELKRAIAAKADVHFVRIESHGEQDLTQFAGAVFAVHDPESKEPGGADRYALAVVKWESPKKNGPAWWVPDVVFPYKDKTFVAPAPEKKAGDDGHGHSH